MPSLSNTPTQPTISPRRSNTAPSRRVCWDCPWMKAVCWPVRRSCSTALHRLEQNLPHPRLMSAARALNVTPHRHFRSTIVMLHLPHHPRTSDSSQAQDTAPAYRCHNDKHPCATNRDRADHPPLRPCRCSCVRSFRCVSGFGVWLEVAASVLLKVSRRRCHPGRLAWD